MFRVTKEFTFEAAHRLTQVPKDHKCARVHGHSYRFEVDIEAHCTDHRGMVIEYAELDALVKPIIDLVDHQWLGAGEIMVDGSTIAPVFPFESTAENIAEWIGHNIRAHVPLNGSCKCAEVRLYETRTTCATWRPR